MLVKYVELSNMSETRWWTCIRLERDAQPLAMSLVVTIGAKYLRIEGPIDRTKISPGIYTNLVTNSEKCLSTLLAKKGFLHQILSPTLLEDQIFSSLNDFR